MRAVRQHLCKNLRLATSAAASVALAFALGTQKISSMASGGLFDQKADAIDGTTFDFGQLEGRVTLITNVASR